MAAEGRASHPCVSRRCGHSPESHLRTPELEGTGETVVWCARCRRHEVRTAWILWGARRRPLETERALPFSAV